MITLFQVRPTGQAQSALENILRDRPAPNPVARKDGLQAHRLPTGTRLDVLGLWISQDLLEQWTTKEKTGERGASRLRREPLAETEIDSRIAGRIYQQEAIRLFGNDYSFNAFMILRAVQYESVPTKTEGLY